MPSIYLQSSDYAMYGVPNTTTASQAIQASAIIDGFLDRQEGLIWIPDATGNPAYMQALQPNIVLTASNSISPANNVVVNVTGAIASVQIGSILILDRANPSFTEACTVVSVSATSVTLQTVLFSHSAGFLLEADLTIVEKKNMPQGRPKTNLSKWPVVNLLAGQGQYGFPRRGDTRIFYPYEINLLAIFSQYGGPPVYESFDVKTSQVEPDTGELWVPAGILLSYFTQIRIYYVAGWTYTSLPYEIKQACANIINAQNSANVLGINGPIKSLKQGDTQIVRFGGGTSNNIFDMGNNFSVLDGDTKNLLMPYRSRKFS